MDHQGSGTPHSVKRVVLPSGKTIEVVYFEEPKRPADLCLCPDCGSQLVQPTAWEDAGSGSWWVTLRCPECETIREGRFGETVLDAFDERLEAGSEELQADYQHLCRANMAAEVERFVAAIGIGAIAPEDF